MKWLYVKIIYKKKSWRKYREIENKMNEENEPLGSEEKLGMIANIMDKVLIRKSIKKHVLNSWRLITCCLRLQTARVLLVNCGGNNRPTEYDFKSFSEASSMNFNASGTRDEIGQNDRLKNLIGRQFWINEKH